MSHYSIIVRGDVPVSDCLQLHLLKTDRQIPIESVTCNTVQEERFYAKEPAFHALAIQQSEILFSSIFFKTKNYGI